MSFEDFQSLRRSTRATLCVECGKCTTMCPLASEIDFSARRIVNQDPQAEMEGRGVGVGRCLTCTSCEQRCPQGVRVTDYVKGLRELVPTHRRRPYPHGGFFQTAARTQNGVRVAAERPAWLADDVRVAEEGEVGLFVGCLPLFDFQFQSSLKVRTTSIANAAIRILNRLGIEPVLVPEERCCGHDLLWSGVRDAFVDLAEANLKAFQKRGVKDVVTSCAECARTWSVDYPAVSDGYRPRVQHMAQVLADHLERGDLTFANGRKTTVTYQDPCRLGRHLGVYDAPRRVIEAIPGTRLQEMPRHGRDSLCCGTSGFIHCDAVSRRLQEERLRSAESTRARTLVTACPKCYLHFNCAKTENERRGERVPAIEMMDLTVYAANALDGREEPEPVAVHAGQEIGETR